tara:strand:+ start:343 stop:1053 length:711 start_codon:yes stop_codon:yes gene_type:complete
MNFSKMKEKSPPKSSYEVYNYAKKKRTKFSILDELFPKLPKRKYAIIYADPPWHYGGKMQFDRSGMLEQNSGWGKNVFISAASFKYPTIKTNELKLLDVKSIAEDDCLLFMWATNPHLQQAIELGTAWGFDYKTVGFVWNKMVHNPGQYTVSYCELCLIFKRGKIPQPRGARNVKQLVEVQRGEHSVKPELIAENISKMFPQHRKIELFSRVRRKGWDAWGLETVHKDKIISKEDI